MTFRSTKWARDKLKKRKKLFVKHVQDNFSKKEYHSIKQLVWLIKMTELFIIKGFTDKLKVKIGIKLKWKQRDRNGNKLIEKN